MKKIDLDATLAEIRKAMEASGAMPDQDAAELASNRDGIDAMVEFARWNLTQRDILEPDDYVAAVALLLSTVLIGAMSAVEGEDHPMAYNEVFSIMIQNVQASVTGNSPEGSSTVPHVMRDVGDA